MRKLEEKDLDQKKTIPSRNKPINMPNEGFVNSINMATVLFINRTDLVRNSIIDGNVDTDKFIQFIKIAQQIDIQQIIGTNMYTGLTDAIVAGIDLPAMQDGKLY